MTSVSCPVYLSISTPENCFKTGTPTHQGCHKTGLSQWNFYKMGTASHGTPQLPVLQTGTATNEDYTRFATSRNSHMWGLSHGNCHTRGVSISLSVHGMSHPKLNLHHLVFNEHSTGRVNIIFWYNKKYMEIYYKIYKVSFSLEVGISWT